MTRGVGGSTASEALAHLARQFQDRAPVAPIGLAEYRQRVAAAQALLRQQGLSALYAHAGTNMRYFSGTVWHPSERLVGLIIPAEGEPQYIAPAFEEGTLREYMVLPGALHVWEEHESPYALCRRVLAELGLGASASRLAISEDTPLFVVDGQPIDNQTVSSQQGPTDFPGSGGTVTQNGTATVQ